MSEVNNLLLKHDKGVKTARPWRALALVFGNTKEVKEIDFLGTLESKGWKFHTLQTGGYSAHPPGFKRPKSQQP